MQALSLFHERFSALKKWQLGCARSFLANHANHQAH